MIEIDGSTLEGGGQVLRTAGALSCILGKPFRIRNIRANRPKPGLQAQHLAGILALAEVCNAKCDGAALHSTSLTFSPGHICGGKHSFSIGTAGSATLLAQTILPVLLFASTPSHITICGGTHVPFSPTYDYFANVFLPATSSFGFRASARLIRPGWYPKGGGKLELMAEPAAKVTAASFLSRKPATNNIHGISLCSGLPISVAQRQAAAVRAKFPSANINIAAMPADSPGSALTLWTSDARSFFGASALGKPGKPAEAVGEDAVGFLSAELASNAAADSHLADQLLLYAALAEGESVIHTSQITRHAHTNAWVIGQFIGKRILIDGAEKIMRVRGIGREAGTKT